MFFCNISNNYHDIELKIGRRVHQDLSYQLQWLDFHDDWKFPRYKKANGPGRPCSNCQPLFCMLKEERAMAKRTHNQKENPSLSVAANLNVLIQQTMQTFLTRIQFTRFQFSKFNILFTIHSEISSFYCYHYVDNVEEIYLELTKIIKWLG